MALERKFPRENIDEPYLPPVEEVLNLRQRGLSNDAIASSLGKDYSQNQISDALTQAEIKRNIAGKYPYSENNVKQLEDLAPSPSLPDLEPTTQPDFQDYEYSAPQQEFSQPMMPMQPSRYQEEHVEELVESVVNEKWQELTEKLGDLSVWKETTKNDIESIKQEILRFESRLENIQRSVLGKVADYGKEISNLGSDIKALEQVLQKILGPLTTNVKELSKIAERVKKERTVKSSKRKK